MKHALLIVILLICSCCKDTVCIKDVCLVCKQYREGGQETRDALNHEIAKIVNKLVKDGFNGGLLTKSAVIGLLGSPSLEMNGQMVYCSNRTTNTGETVWIEIEQGYVLRAGIGSLTR